MKPTLYLCGGIYNLTKKQQKEWRNQVKKELSKHYKIIDPTNKPYTGRNQKEIVEYDKQNIIRSDVIIVNATKPSWGTAMEILYAYQHHKKIIVFTKDKNPWLEYHSTVICETLQQVIITTKIWVNVYKSLEKIKKETT